MRGDAALRASATGKALAACASGDLADVPTPAGAPLRARAALPTGSRRWGSARAGSA